MQSNENKINQSDETSLKPSFQSELLDESRLSPNRTSQNPVSPSGSERKIRSPMTSPKPGQRDYNRLKYYNALQTAHTRETGLIDDDFLVMPDHIIPPEYFLKTIPGMDTSDEQGKHGSFVTIFSCWNGMAGTGVVTMPWAFQGSGILLGSALTFIAFTISFITCYFVVLTAGKDIDYTVTLTRYFGRKGWIVGMVCFILNLYVPILIFF